MYKLKAVLSPNFNESSDRPYAVVLDVYDNEGYFIESGADWRYFPTEEEAEKFCNEYNNFKYK